MAISHRRYRQNRSVQPCGQILVRLALTAPHHAGAALVVLLSRPSWGAYTTFTLDGLPSTTTSRVPLALLYSLRQFVGRLILGFDSPYTARLSAGLARYYRRYPLPFGDGPLGILVMPAPSSRRRRRAYATGTVSPGATRTPPIYPGVRRGFLPSALYSVTLSRSRQTVKVPGHSQGDRLHIEHSHHSFLDFFGH